VQIKEVSDGWYEAGMCCTRVPVCGKEEREESAEGIVLFCCLLKKYISKRANEPRYQYQFKVSN